MTVVYLLTFFLQPLFLYVLALLITRFVFLENGINGKVGKIYLLVSSSLIILSQIAGIDFSIIIFLFLAIYIFCGYKGRIIFRFLHSLLALPVIGLTNGLVSVPITIAYTTWDNEDMVYIATLIVFVVIMIAGVIIYRLKKASIDDILVNSDNRKLRKWELLLLVLIGLLLTINPANMIIVYKDQFSDVPEFMGLILILCISQFITTLTVISLVLVGNKQTHYHNKVSSMQFNIIIMMAEIVESRDKNTGGHIKRTARYVEIIAKQLRRDGKFKDILTDSFIDNICVAAPLHDIGKIHVSDAILNKNGPLDDSEFAVMKTHAEAGRDLLGHAKLHLGEFEYLNIAIDMAGSHHEWWDGSAKGYPLGTSGEEIPLCARIMAVADVFDALSSKRCYKPAMPIEKAFSIIRSERGTHFDPDVIDAFFNAEDEIRSALASFNAEDEDDTCILESIETHNH